MTARQTFYTFLAIAVLALATSGATARAADGVILVASKNDVKTTANKLEKILTEKGVTVFARVNHAAGAKSIGQSLRPMELLIFGNPKLGTPLMQKNQEIGLDLPLKALIFEAENGTTYIAYNDPAYLSKRHGMTEPAKVFQQMSGALKNFTAAAAK